MIKGQTKSHQGRKVDFVLQIELLKKKERQDCVRNQDNLESGPCVEKHCINWRQRKRQGKPSHVRQQIVSSNP